MGQTSAVNVLFQSTLWSLALLGRAQFELGGGTNGWSQQGWNVQVDGVMGGKSSGQVAFPSGSMIFSGSISLDGGGFSSVRRSLGGSRDLSSFAGVLVELETQVWSSGSVEAPLGLHIQLGDSSTSYGYAAAVAIPFSADPASDAYQAYIPMEGFDRGSRWGYVCSSCKLDTTEVKEVDIYVLYQEGPFEARIKSITAVSDMPDLPPVPSIGLTSADVSAIIEKTISSGGFLYDKGYKELCVAQYEVTAKQIAASTGLSTALSGLACAGLRKSSTMTKAEKAWVLRKAFDALLADVYGQERRADSNYPSYAQGSWLPAPGASAEDCNTLLDQSTGVGNLSSPVASTDVSEGSKLDAFLGPFTGMGISGWNDLGSFAVNGPAECAAKCLETAQCRSFDYGARGSVSTECWLSTANRAVAGSDYSEWELYDYYELKLEEVEISRLEVDQMPDQGGFVGPFEGMGITGWNNLGQSFVDSPDICAEKCMQLSSCASFDYGARSNVRGECWLSTANRASAGSSYTSWPLYDYYERTLSPSSAVDQDYKMSEGRFQDGDDDEDGLSPVILAVICTASGMFLALLAAFVYDRFFRNKRPSPSTMHQHVIAGNPVATDGYGSNPTVVVVGQPVKTKEKSTM